VTKAWTLPGDVVEKAKGFWGRGTPLAAEAAGTEFTPIQVPVKGPAAKERAADFDTLRLWLDAWQSAALPLRVEWKTVNDRVLGRVRLPVAAYLDSVDDVAKVCGAQALKELAMFRRNLSMTPERFRGFVARRPLRVVAIGTDWSAVLSAVAWLADNPNSGLHARQIPAEGVHTKIVEKYRRDIAEMAPAPAAVAVSGRGWFAARYGLAAKPARIRMRFLDRSLSGVGPYADVEVPVGEAAANPVAAERVLVVENEVSFLALPDMAGMVAVFGGGRAAGSLVEQVPWLLTAPIWYWGDVDTWGFVILDGLRSAADGRTAVRSLLMDEATLLEHRGSWVVEEKPTSFGCRSLTPAEADTYSGLISDRWGHQVRLEQERIPWPTVQAALTSLTSS
jgi:hypothetical protein